MFGLTIWHVICAVLSLGYGIAIYQLHIRKRPRFDARGLPIVDKIRPMPKTKAPRESTVDTSKCTIIVGGPGAGGMNGGTGGNSGSC